MLRSIIVAVALISAVAAQAQLRIRLGGNAVNYQLLLQDSAGKELKITPDQKKKIEGELENYRQTMQSEIQSVFSGGVSQEDAQKAVDEILSKLQPDLKKRIAKVLSEDQMKRFSQIELQSAGVKALQRDEIVKTLDITKDQAAKIAKLSQEMDDIQEKAMENAERETVPGGGVRFVLGAAEEKKLAEARKKNLQQALAVLTEDQQKKWAELTGPEFK